MPKKKRDELIWQIEMLRFLPTDPPGKSYEEIHEEMVFLGFGMTLRSVQRAVPSLKDLGLQLNDEEKIHRWYWPRQYRSMERQLMPAAEALSLRLIEQIVAPLLPDSLRHVLDGRFVLARERLEKLRKTNHRVDWPEKVAAIPSHFTLRPPKIDPDVLRVVQEALLEDRELTIDYQGLNDSEPKRRRVHPRALIQSGGVPYLVATTPDSEDGPEIIKQYRIDRISLAIGSSRRVAPSNFDLKQYLAEDKDKVGSLEKIRLELWVSTNLAKILKDTTLSDDQILNFQDDGATVTATVRNTLRLQQWLLGHRDNLEVIKPAVLRNWMAKKLEAALARYR